MDIILTLIILVGATLLIMLFLKKTLHRAHTEKADTPFYRLKNTALLVRQRR